MDLPAGGGGGGDVVLCMFGITECVVMYSCVSELCNHHPIFVRMRIG